MTQCIQEEKKHCISLYVLAQYKNPGPGVMKITILLDPFLVFITVYLICLIHTPVY